MANWRIAWVQAGQNPSHCTCIACQERKRCPFAYSLANDEQWCEHVREERGR